MQNPDPLAVEIAHARRRARAAKRAKCFRDKYCTCELCLERAKENQAIALAIDSGFNFQGK